MNAHTTKSVGMAGALEVIVGPMFSGKTAEMLRRVRRHLLAGRQCKVIKYKRDLRYSADDVVTHDGTSMPAHACEMLMEEQLLADIQNIPVIGIDEGQFFPDLVEFCEMMLACGKTVIVAALSSTFERNPFPVVSEVLAKATMVTMEHAVCMGCGRDAPFSRRLDASVRAVQVIGGADKYAAVCYQCFHKQDFSPRKTQK